MIRVAVLGDVPEIVDLWKEFMEDNDHIVLDENPKIKPYTLRKKSAPENYRDFITNHIKSGTGGIFVAEVDDKIVGYALVYIQDEIPIFVNEKIGYISDLFVKKDHRGMKISSELRDKAVEWFKGKGMKYMSLKVYSDNKHARSVYRKWGFMDFHVEMRKKL